MSKATLTDYQLEILLSLRDCREDGLENYGQPLGMSPLTLEGAGQAAAGLFRRGLVEKRNSIVYITQSGLDEIEKNSN